MVKNHARVAELLAVYRDLDEAERRQVDQHLQECRACAARLAAYRTMDRDLTRLVDPRPNERLREEFHVALGLRERQGGWFNGIRRRLVRFPALAGQAVELAVLALLIVGLGFILGDRLYASPTPIPTPRPTLSSATTTSPTDPALAEIASRAHTSEAGPVNRPQTTDLIRPDNPGEGSRVASPIEPGLPASSQGAAVPQTALIQAEEGQVYIVQADDSLWKLAEKYLGNGRRFGEIIEATHAKRAGDPSFALIEAPDLIRIGAKLWIPAAGIGAPLAEVPKEPVPATRTVSGPNGHIAFSFWNDHPARCTYEIDVIDVAACLSDPNACQSTRRIFSLNNVSEPALSPGGDRLAFRGWGEPPSEDSPYLDCAPPVNARYLANTTLDGTEFRGTGGFWEDSHPDWSPDGQQLLFDTERHGDGIARILVINADGSNERDLRIAGQYPAWGPDGQRFVYRGCDLTGNRCGLWLAYATPVNPWELGANMIGPVVQNEQAAHPDWSPVSDQIVYQSPKSGSWDLYVVNVDGSGLRQLTSDSGIEGLPSWSSDGRWIAYLSDTGGNWGIWIIRADGGEQHLLFPFDGGIFTPQAVEPYGQRDWIDEQISWSK